MIKVSVIVPVYNMETKLKRCLDSLVCQTLKDIEIIIINDGSNDDSIRIINDYKKKYKNVIVIDRENRGISASRNEGIDISKGKYIGFVDSDDYVELDMYEKMYSIATSKDSDIVICNFKMFYENINEVIYKDISKGCKISNIYDNPSMINKVDYAPWNKIYKKSLWDVIRFPLNTKYEDLEAVLKVFLNTKKISYCNNYLYNYLLNPKGETLTVNDRVFDIYKIINSLYDYTLKKSDKIRHPIKELYINKIFVYNHYILNTKNRDLSMEYMTEGYNQIKNHYKTWKLFYIKNSKSFKNLLLRIIQSNKTLYFMYIKYRTKGDN